MKRIRSVLKITTLALVVFAAAAVGCSKTNKVDISEGDLAVGEKCTAGPNDPCAGTCFQGVCRAPCGANRECPAGQACFGDDANAVCAPASSTKFDLLTDCAEGCEVELSPFGREGYFRLCERDESFQYDLSPSEAASANLDPRQVCRRTVGNAIAVKGDVLYGLDIHAERPTCDTYLKSPVGVLGNTLVSHQCSQIESGELVSKACLGRLINADGKTYLVREQSCTPPELADDGDTFYMFEFSPEPVELPCAEAEPPTCAKPTFPPVGPAVSGYEGFWVRCDNEGLDNLCLQPTAENATSALVNCPDLNYETFESGGFAQDALYVRSDGHGMAWEGGFFSASCNYAFRQSSDGRVAVAGRAHAPVGTLEIDYEGWKLVTTSGGETLLWRTDEYVCGEANAGNFFKKVQVPQGVSDPCDSSLPKFTF